MVGTAAGVSIRPLTLIRQIRTEIVLGVLAGLVASSSYALLIDTDTTWDAAGSPYTFSEDVGVAAGVTLTILPGAEVHFSRGFGVSGRLVADGCTISNPNLDQYQFTFQNAEEVTIENCTIVSNLITTNPDTSLIGNEITATVNISWRGGSPTVQNNVMHYHIPLSLPVGNQVDGNKIRNNEFTHPEAQVGYIYGNIGSDWTWWDSIDGLTRFQDDSQLSNRVMVINDAVLTIPQGVSIDTGNSPIWGRTGRIVMTGAYISGSYYSVILDAGGVLHENVFSGTRVQVTGAGSTKITGNRFSHGQYGLLISNNAGSGNKHLVKYNSFSDHSIAGLSVGTEINLDARYNYWGDPSGPTHAGNPTGTGDAVSDGVIYEPWLEESVVLGGPSASFSWSPASPLAGETVQFSDESTGSDLTWKWDFDGDGETDSIEQDPPWIFSSEGPKPVTLTVSNGSDPPSTTSKVVLISNTGSMPWVTSVTREYSGVFLQGTDVSNQFDVAVDWQGTPGSVSFSINGGPAVVETGTPSGASHTFDIGTDFTPQFGPSVVTVTPTNGEGVTGATHEEKLYLFPYTEWLNDALSGNLGIVNFTTGSGEVLAEIDWEFPQPHLRAGCTLECAIDPECKACKRIPHWVPYVGGPFDLLETYASVDARVSSLGPGDFHLFGQTGFYALGGGKKGAGLLGQVEGSGEFRLMVPGGLELTHGSMRLGLYGVLKKEVGIIEAIPALAPYAKIGFVKWFNKRARIVGEISPSLDMTASWAQDDGQLKFQGGTGLLDVDMKATLVVDAIKDVLTASGWVAGGGSMLLAVPEPFLREWELWVEAGVQYELNYLFLHKDDEFVYRAHCTWQVGGTVQCAECDTCGTAEAVTAYFEDGPSGDLALIEIDYESFGPYNESVDASLPRMTNSLTPASVQEVAVLGNVFPGATPTLLETSAGELLLWVHQDIADPVLQGTEISWSLDDGTGWSAGALLADDTQVELTPKAAVDADGNVVAVWLRIKDPAFDTTISTVDDLPLFYNELEVVSAVFDPVTRTWGSITALTSDAAFDSNLNLAHDGSGNLMLTWLSNAGGEFLSTSTSPTTLMFSPWDATTDTWSAPAAIATGLGGVYTHESAYKGTAGFVIVPRDPDTTVDDNEVLDLYTWNGAAWSAASTFASGAVENRTPSVTYDASGEGHVVWVRAGDLVQGTLSSPTPVTVRPSSGSMAFYGAKFFTNAQGNLTLVWQEVVDNGPANLFARIFDASAASWSEDRRLTAEAEIKQHALEGYYGSDGILRAAYLATEIARTTQDAEIAGQTVTFTNIPVDGATDLRILEHSLIKDLAVDDADLAIVPFAPNEGESVTANLTVHNAGDFSVEPFSVDLYVGDPVSGGTLVGSSDVLVPISAGDTVNMDIVFSFPAGGGDVVAVVDPTNAITEITDANNRATVYLENIAPTAVVVASVTSGVAPLTVSFDASPSFDVEGDELTFNWTFADGSLGQSGAEVEHTFATGGQFPVAVAVTDARGAIGTRVVVITVTHTSYPNCFYPVTLDLASETISTTKQFDACSSISAGPSFVVNSEGNATFRAGESVVLNDGFSVETDGSFEVILESQLAAP